MESEVTNQIIGLSMGPSDKRDIIPTNQKEEGKSDAERGNLTMLL